MLACPCATNIHNKTDYATPNTYRFILFESVVSVAREKGLIEEMSKKDQRTSFDVAIVGAGYAGLSCALVLGRHLVPTVIFDGGMTRNATTRRIHGYLGFENKSPLELLNAGWNSISKYQSVSSIKARVSRISKSSDDSTFLVKGGGKTFRVKFVLIATGVRDVKPKIQGFERLDGDGAWHCPYCDGHEASGKRLLVIVSGDRALAYVKEFLGWTRDITIFLQDIKLSINDRRQATALGIRIVEDTLIRITGGKGTQPKRLFGKSGDYSGDVVFYRLGYQAQTCLAEQLGCSLWRGYVKVDSKQRTSVPGVYAAGDVDTDRHLVVLAAAAGSRAAMDIYENLLREAVRTKIQRS
jgi:thioredoxin reductase